MWRIIATLFALLFLPTLAEAQQQFQANSQINVKSYISVNNTTAIVVKATGGTIYQVDAYNNGTSLAYVKFINATSATCGTDTPQARYLIPFGATSSGGGFVTPNINGDAYGKGIVMCITTGIADNDATAPSANQFIVNVHFK